MRLTIFTFCQDINAKSRAETEAKNTDEKMTKLRVELDGMESKLEKEESQLEKLRDSLKGQYIFCPSSTFSNDFIYFIGKTEIFSSQIESLQTDLQPWAEQIAEKNASIDLATNERDLLAGKTTGVGVAIEEAEALLEKLAVDDETKVNSFSSFRFSRCSRRF